MELPLRWCLEVRTKDLALHQWRRSPSMLLRQIPNLEAEPVGDVLSRQVLPGSCAGNEHWLCAHRRPALLAARPVRKDEYLLSVRRALLRTALAFRLLCGDRV